MPEVIANLPDGTQLHFPDGTDPSVVQNVVRQKLGSPVSSTPSAQPQKTFLGMPVTGLKTGYQNFGQGFNETTPLDAVRPFDAPASIALGSKVAEMTPGGLVPKAIAGVGVGAGAYLGLDSFLRSIGGKEPDLTDSAVNLGANELGGRLLGKLVPRDLPTSLKDFSKFEPTYSQYLDKLDPDTLSGKVAKAFQGPAKFLEDVMAPSAKADAIKNSGKIADQALTAQASKLSGRTPGVLDNPNFHAQTIQTNQLENSLRASFDESEKQATLAKAVAMSNPQPLPDGRIVNGPVNLNSSLEKANQIVQEATLLHFGPSEEQKPLVNQAYKLIQGTDAKFDPQTGKVISSNPIGFNEAWNQKQQLDDFGGWNKSKNDLTHTDAQFRDLTRSVNQDIEDSIPRWQNDPNKVATKAWQNAKATVEQRNNLFFPDGSGTKLGDIVQDTDSPLPAIKAVIKDPVVLQRALNSGNLKFPSGTVESNNIRGDLGAFALKDIFEGSKSLDPKNPTGGVTLNPQTLIEKWNDPSFVESKKLLFNASQRGDIDQLLKNIAFTQTKQNAFGSYLSKAYLVRSGLALAPALFTG